MADKIKAIGIVVNFIRENELYSFKSLAESTQQKLINTYGTDIEVKVNMSLGIN